MADAELTLFNRRVLRWAKAFDRKYRDASLVLGWACDRDTHQTLRNSWPTLAELSRKHVREGRMDKPVAERTLRRHVAELEASGVVKVDRGKQGFADKHRGMNAANAYRIDFTKVISEGRAVFHDFWASLEDDYVPQCGQKETVIGQKVGQKVGPVSRSSRKDQDLARTRECEPEGDSGSRQSREDPPVTGRGRVPFSYPAYKPSAAADRNPSNDDRLTGSSAIDLISAQFPDSVEREMASEFVKMLRDYDCALVVKAAGFFFRDNSYALRREISNPRAYARKCAEPVRETLDGWKRQEETRRRQRANVARDAQREAEADARRRAEDAAHEARGEVKIDLLTLDDPTGVPGWLPRGQAVQVPGLCGGLVWIPAAQTHTDFSAPDFGRLLDEHPGGYQEGDEGELGAGR